MTMPTGEQFARIQLLLLDVDGVLTDGRIIYSSSGEELKTFHVRDGWAIKAWQQSGRKIAILSGRSSPAVARRATELGIEWIVQGAGDKVLALQRILEVAGVSPSQICAMGDDLPDVPVFREVAMSVAVADAVPELKAVATHVTVTAGGCGAVREAIEWLMRGQETWTTAIAPLVGRSN